MATGRVAVGDLTHIPDEDAAGFVVAVPIRVDGRPRFVLTTIVSPEAIRDVIHKQRVPDDGVVSIFDAQGRHVARSRAHDEYLGQPGSETLRALMGGREEGWGPTTTLEGHAIYAAFSRSERTGWSVAVGVSRDRVDASLRASMWGTAIGFALSFALGGLLSYVLARRLTRAAKALHRAATAVGGGLVPKAADLEIEEMQVVADALTDAAVARSSAERAREEVIKLERKARSAAERANRSKDEFVAMLGHELRNPLGAISNALHLLEVADADPTHRDKTHRIIRRQLDHLTYLVDDLLDVSRVVRGKIRLNREDVDVAVLVGDCVATLRAGDHLNAHDVQMDLSPAWCHVDPDRVAQLVNNILGNALKYTPEGGAISVSVAREGSAAVIEVRDSGVGIAPELLPHVFDLFTQEERARARSEGGLGIGLTLVRTIAELHGGDVTATSEGSGKGAVFRVELPAIEEPERHSEAAPAAAPPARGLKVLLVEDNDDARETMQLLLELGGHEVDTAADGPSGVECALDAEPDVAFVDIGLPGFDGLEVARRIRDASARSPMLVALSGYGTEEDRAASLAAGFDVHLTKPLGNDDLQGVLASVRPQQGADGQRRSSG